MFNRWMTKRDNKRGHLIHLYTTLKSRKMVSPIRRGMLVSPMFFFARSFGVFRPTREFFTHKETSSLSVKSCKFQTMLGTHDRRAVSVQKCAKMSTGTSAYNHMVIFEDTWHSHLLASVWQWSCHYLFWTLRSAAAGIRTPNLPHARWTLWRIAPPPRLI